MTCLDSHIITHSSETAFRSCPRRYYLAYVKGLRPSFDSEPLRIGSAFHIGLEASKNGFDQHDVEMAVRAEYHNADTPPYLTPDEFSVEQETAVAMSLAWHRKWSKDTIARYVAVELPFDLPLLNPYTRKEHPYLRNCGKIDGIAELPDGRIALIEHKTTSEDVSIGSDYWRRLMLDAQISRYWLASIRLGYDVSTVVYDVTRKPMIKPKAIAKADRVRATADGHYHGAKLTSTCPERESPALFGARLLDDMTDRADFYFARNEIPRLREDLEEFTKDQWSIIRTMSSYETDGYWPRNTAACTSPYRCPFLDVCRGLRGDPEEHVPDGFKQARSLHPELNTGQSAGKELA